MTFRFLHTSLAAGLVLLGLPATAQISQLEATRIAETILSNQNPLVVIEEISHDGLFIAPRDNGYTVGVQGPRFPGREAFAEAMEFTLTPVDGDLVQVQVTQLPQSNESEDFGTVSFTPTVFQGLYSRNDRGFQSLQFGMSDLAYTHEIGTLGLDRFETNLGLEDGVYTLTLSGVGFEADIQDVMDFQESAGAFSLTFSIDADTGNGGDLMFVANRIFELILDPGNEDTNTLGKERPLPEDLMGLGLQVSILDLDSSWLRLRDQGPREVIADIDLESIFLRGQVIPADDGMATLQLNFGANEVNVQTPDSLVSAQADIFALNFDLSGFDSKDLGRIFSSEEGAQTTAMSQIFGNMRVMEIVGLGKDIDIQSPDLSAFLTLEQGDFRIGITSPHEGAPNFKDIAVEIDLANLAGDYPEAVEDLEPAWSSMIEPSLPETMDIRILAEAIPGELWKGLLGRFFDADAFPEDTATPTVITSLGLDGTRYYSQLFKADVGGRLTLNPDADLFATGEISLVMDNLRPLIGAMQRGARVPNRDIAQLLTLGSIGLATVSGYARRTDDGRQEFIFDFQESGLPTINGRPLPVSF